MHKNLTVFLTDLNRGNISAYSNEELRAFESDILALTLKSYEAYAADYLKAVGTPHMIAQKKDEMVRFSALLPEGARVLVLAAGSGDEARFFQEQGFVVDVLEPSVAFAPYLEGLTKVDGTLTDLSALAETGYDAVFCYAGVLHLIDAPERPVGAEKAFYEAVRVLKPGGYMYQHVRAGEGAYIQKETQRFFQLYNADRLKALGEAAGLCVHSCHSISKEELPAPFRDWLSVTYQKGS